MKPPRDVFFFGDRLPWEPTTAGMRRQILGCDNQIMMVRIHADSGAIGAPHTHFHTQTTYIVSGTFEFDVEGTVQRVSAGDALYFEPGSRHGFVCLDEGEVIDCFSPVREDFLK